ncbi:integral membrane protein [Aspergillus taichungensis]|uniref:Integral membrane protein n=1 Tax=Aspergillus taichungensis TaxID=482145 RepID=A0A2J5I230_9EURO|nr:integral membrane protein [Aspergillus taichungensis]
MNKYQMPASPPPPGVKPNLVNPPGSEYEIFSISIAMCATATLVLIARLYTRGVILRALGLDDWLCVGGSVCAWIFAILSIASMSNHIPNGYGVHIWNLRVHNVINFKKVDLGEENVYAIGVGLVKTAILVFYLRLSPERRFRQITLAIMGFVILYSVLSVLLFTIGCIPVDAMWDITLMDRAKCFDQLSFVYANAACNVFSDLVTLVLPIKLCYNLQTTFRQKALLLGLFTMGSFACVVAIVRIVTMLPFGHSNDLTWYKVTIAKWCMVEINVCIICACLPAMRPLFAKAFPGVFSTVGSRGTPQGPSADSYQMTAKKRPRRWDYITDVDSQWTTVESEEGGQRRSERPVVATKNDEEAIMRSTDITVAYSPR